MSQQNSEVVELYSDFFTTIPEWMTSGSCVSSPLKLHPVDDAQRIVDEMCPSCPVKEQCWGLSSELTANRGAFGGKNFGEG